MFYILNKFQNRIARKATLSALTKNSKVSIGKNFKLGDDSQFSVSSDIQNLSIGNEVELRSLFSCVIAKGANLKIENSVFMNRNCSINCLEKIEIGENTLFGEGVKLYDHNHKITTEPDYKIEHREFNTAPISIGKNCWLGSNVIVLKGVTIGDNAVIGAGCIIYEEVPSGAKIVNKQNLVNLNHEGN